MPTPRNLINKRFSGFTLAELLICLVILGEIATFTIPKILTAQTNVQNIAKAKEVAAMISEAFTTYSLTNTVSATTSLSDLTPYINYVALDTTTLNDGTNTNTSTDCSNVATFQCFRLHNGGMLVSLKSNVKFGGTTSNNAFYFAFDPQIGYSGSTTGTGKAIVFYLYANGRIVDGAHILPSTQTNDFGSLITWPSPNLNDTPTWFSW